VYVVLSSGPPIEPSTTFKHNGKEYQLNAQSLQKISVLGQGAHGFVQKMRHDRSAAVMAVKVKLMLQLRTSV